MICMLNGAKICDGCMACEAYNYPDKYDKFDYEMDNADYIWIKEND